MTLKSAVREIVTVLLLDVHFSSRPTSLRATHCRVGRVSSSDESQNYGELINFPALLQEPYEGI